MLISVLGCAILLGFLISRGFVMGFNCELDLIRNVREKDLILTELQKASLAASFVKVDLEAVCGIRIMVNPFSQGKAEGDMAIDIKKYINQIITERFGRSAIAGNHRLWPNGRVPYTISSQYGAYARKQIAKAITEVEAKTCIRFVAKTRRDKDYVSIRKDNGCYSMVGKVGGNQTLSLDVRCLHTGTIIHELMHTVGFFHEQSRADRDDYVEILWQNVKVNQKDQFQKYPLSTIRNLGSYDYGSIMHYGPYAWSRNKKRTIKARPGKVGGDKIGQRAGLSQKDIEKIRKLYKCPVSPIATTKTTTATTTPPTTTTQKTTTTTKSSLVCKDTWKACDMYKGLLKICETKDLRKKCARTCQLCVDECADHHSDCDAWASQGYCNSRTNSYRKYMEKNCKKACGTCF